MPVMVELMTYRGGHHSTSDDATRYRQPEEIMHWARVDNPIIRFQKLLFNLEYLTKEEVSFILFLTSGYFRLLKLELF